MSCTFFAIPALDSDAQAEVFNTFCASTRVVQVERHFVHDGAASYWALCVVAADGPGPLPAALKKAQRTGPSADAAGTSKVDYKAVLNEADFRVFAALRALRKTLAEQEGVPLYAVLTNEQLAELARRRCSSAAALGEIEGVGEARIARYGAAMLACVAEQGGASAAPAA